MNSLSVNTQKTLSTRIAEARVGATIAQTENEKLEAGIRKLWLDVMNFCGQKIEPEVVELGARLIVPDLKRNYPHMKAKELIVVFQEGKVGKYGDYVTFSAKLLMEWIRQYSTSQERAEAIKQAETAALPEKVKTPEDQNLEDLQHIRRLAYEMGVFTPKEKLESVTSRVLRTIEEGARVWIFDQAVKRGWLTISANAKFAAIQAAGRQMLQEWGNTTDREEKKAKNALMEVMEFERPTPDIVGKMSELHQKVFNSAVWIAKSNLVQENHKIILDKTEQEINKLLPLQNDARD